jgi:hypothetical protein
MVCAAIHSNLKGIKGMVLVFQEKFEESDVGRSQA